MAFVPIYILILGITIIVDYFAGIYLEESSGNRKKFFLILSLLANIGMLAIFKYYHFIDQNIAWISNFFGFQYHLPAFHILLPIGLSFHTFQAMSYTIEVYRGNQKAERNFGIYSLYVMFYPQLVAGPIERPQNLLHQFYEKHHWEWQRVKSGLLQMLFGIFKKVVIADRIALAVDPAYQDIAHQSGLNLTVAATLYSFQIYCDFSGYSDVAIGASRIMGFKLMDNFNSPYLAKSLPDFWRRWHISLSTWFKDYVYFSLGGNRVSIPRWYVNILMVFILSGIWHGASWNFIIWGFLHGAFQLIGLTVNRFFPTLAAANQRSKWIIGLYQIWTFVLVTLAWVFFRIAKFSDIQLFFKQLIHFSWKDKLQLALNTNELGLTILLVVFMLIAEKNNWKKTLLKGRYFWLISILATSLIYFLGVFDLKQFIYFQF
jgi:D-alanyl-lipoteichoic acid acyltransferase DltB (MBOAT superfamily)